MSGSRRQPGAWAGTVLAMTTTVPVPPATLPPGLRARALPADLGARLVRAGHDGAGTPVTPFTAEGGEPLRCCLRDAYAGAQIVLAAVIPPGPQGAYRELGPVFLHASPCRGADPFAVPAVWLTRPQVLRSYDAGGRIVGGVLVDGDHGAEAARLLADPSVAFIQSRNVLHGCYLLTVERS